VLAGDAVGIDPQQHVDAVACPFGDLGSGYSFVEPGRYCGVAQVIGSARERAGCVSRAERLFPGRVEYIEVGPFSEGAAART
jgi:hypothetical protein